MSDNRGKIVKELVASVAARYDSPIKPMGHGWFWIENMKLRSIEFLLVSAVAAASVAAILQSTEVSLLAFSTLSYLLFLTAIPMAIGRRNGERAFWTGFLITGILYLVFAITPDSDGFSPRQSRRDFTTRLSIYAFDRLEELDSKSKAGSDDDQGQCEDTERNEAGILPFSNSNSASLNCDDDNPFGAGDRNLETDPPTTGGASSTEYDEDLNHSLAEKVDNVAESGPGFGGRPNRFDNDPEGQFGNPVIAEADFQSLIDLIRETVPTDDWEDSNVVGEIQAFPVNLCGGIIAHSSEGRNFSNFIAISHSAWALMLAWIVGKSSQYSWELGAK